MPIAAYSAALRVNGAANAVTAEACTSLGGGRYQVTNTARRVWDPAVAVTVKDGGVTVSALLYSFNYLFGIVTFVGYTPTGAITVDGSWASMVSVAEGRAFDFAPMRDLLDTSVFGTAFKTKLATLQDVTCSMEVLASPVVDLDGVTGGTQSLISFLENATVKVFEVNLGSQYLRAFVNFDSIKIAAAVTDLVTSTISMQGHSPRSTVSWAVGT